jgi:nickel/cobalt transporter (NiCoT) family protein
VRKLYYNMTITFASVVVAVIIGGGETLGLIARKFGFSGGLWDTVDALNDSFGLLGYVIIGVFALCWVVSIAIYRINGYDAIDVPIAPLAQEKQAA